MYQKAISVLLLAVFITGCSIQQKVEPVNLTKKAELCIIENPKVRDGFLQEFRRVLAARQINHLVVPELNVPESCQWTVTYTARWSWDMTIYMSYAEIKVYEEGQLSGEALYDARRGGVNMSKFNV